MTVANNMVAETEAAEVNAPTLGNQSGTPVATQHLALRNGWRAGARKLRVLVSSRALGAALILAAWRNTMVVRAMRWYIQYFVAVSDKAKCPACGVRTQHKMRYEAVYRAVIHTCARCTAQWGEQAVVKTEQWQVDAILSAPESKTPALDAIKERS